MSDWLVASVTDLVSGALVIVLEFFWLIMVPNENPWRPTHKITAMIMGHGALEEMSLFNFSIAGTTLVLHFALGALMGMILKVIIASFHFDSSPGMLTVADMVFGIVAYVVNFYGMVAVLPWFVSERGSGSLPANLLFGVVTVIIYGMLE